jgi:uncharacterized caspase-like protein
VRFPIALGCLVLAGSVFWLTPSYAEKRVALVVGNSAYQTVPRLANPINDASAVADLFKAAGFDRVEVRRDVGISELRRALSDFSDIASDADVAAFYYAGHGIELDGQNYLIPVDAKIARDFDVEDEALSLDRVLRAIESARQLRLVMLDACRDNPFATRMKRSISSRSIGRGLAKVEPSVPNTLIAFAAKAGSIALDGDSQNSPFTAALIKHIATPGLDIRLAFGRIRDDVMAETAQQQEPFVYGSLGGKQVSIINSPTQELPSPSLGPPLNEAAQAWAATKDTTNTAVLEAFIKRYSDSFYAELARSRLEQLKIKSTQPEIKSPKRDVASQEQEPPRERKVEKPKASQQLVGCQAMCLGHAIRHGTAGGMAASRQRCAKLSRGPCSIPELFQN